MAVDTNIANTMGLPGITQRSATPPWLIARVACAMNARTDPMMTRSSKYLNTIIGKKITGAFSHKENKDKVA
eukprot:10473583-Ditylum_brightwellii.AAC.1